MVILDENAKGAQESFSTSTLKYQVFSPCAITGMGFFISPYSRLACGSKGDKGSPKRKTSS